MAKLCGLAWQVLRLDLEEEVGDGPPQGEKVARALTGLWESFGVRKEPQTGYYLARTRAFEERYTRTPRETRTVRVMERYLEAILAVNS